MASCSDQGPGGSATIQPSLTDLQKEKVRVQFEDLSKIAVYNHTMDKIILLDPNMQKNGFQFADPDDGWNFGTSSNMEFVEDPDGGGEILFISGGGGFGDGAGGVVTAGSTTLSIDYAFCFSVDGETAFSPSGGDIPIDGISGVFGFAGDLEGLANGDFDEDDDPLDFFEGWAYYWVYEDEANGSYDVIDWNEWLDEDGVIEDLNDEGFAFVFDFEDGNCFWAVDGDLNVSGGGMEFDGEYLAWFDFLSSWFDDEDFTGTIDEVSGSGTMGCD